MEGRPKRQTATDKDYRERKRIRKEREVSQHALMPPRRKSAILLITITPRMDRHQAWRKVLMGPTWLQFRHNVDNSTKKLRSFEIQKSKRTPPNMPLSRRVQLTMSFSEYSESRLVSTLFAQLPSRRQYPDYYEIIKQPIALSTIKVFLYLSLCLYPESGVLCLMRFFVVRPRSISKNIARWHSSRRILN